MGTLPPVEEAVARLVTDLTFDTIPADALAGARRLIQDQLALQVACASLPWSQAVLELTRAAHVPGRSHVAATGDEMSVASLGTERGETLLHAIQSGDLDQPACDFAALLKV
jgi:hypothetical protein